MRRLARQIYRDSSLKPALGLLLVAMLAAVTAWSVYGSRKTALWTAERQQVNVTTMLEQAVNRGVTTLDHSMRAARQAMKLPGLAAMPPATRQQVLFDGALTAEGFGGVFIVDETGALLYQSRPDGLDGVNRGGRSYFQAHRTDPSDKLLVSGPVRGIADGQWTLLFSRRLNHPDGSFAGVVVGGLHLSLFQSIFDNLRLDRGSSLALMTATGTMVMRRPMTDGDIGRPFPDHPVLQQLEKSPRGTIEGASEPDGAQRLLTFRQVGDLPLVVTMSSLMDYVYDDWFRRARVIGIVVVVLGFLYVLFAGALRQELSSRKRAEQDAQAARTTAEDLAGELSQALARRDALVRATSDAMLLARLDADGSFRFEDVNPVWERLTGVPAAAAIGRTPHEFLPASVADKKVAHWHECVRTRGVVRFSVSWQGDGHEQHWEEVACPIADAFGVVTGLMATSRNMTEQRALEAKLLQSQRSEAVGQLTAGIAHDFNNLLQAMLGALELASEGFELDDDKREPFEIATEAAQRGASLVHQLLAYSRRQMLSPAPLSPEQITARIVTLVGPMLGTAHTLRTEIGPDAGTVLADPVQLNRCVVDMILNARDATPDGGALQLRVCRATQEAEAAGIPAGEYVRFIVEDEGMGMPAETLTRVFEPFFTTKDVGKGAGLGLPMIQGFARQSGGEVTIESAVGVGTSVSLWLPRVTAAARAAPNIPAGRDGTRPIRQRRRVLVVDDEPSVRRTLSLFLRKAGHDPLQAQNGQEALAVIGECGAPDLLVTDQSMPGITGTELLELAARLHPAMPAMLITGFDRVAGIERLDGRVTVLNKPFQRTTFLEQVEAILDGVQAGPPDPAAEPALTPTVAVPIV